MNDDIKLFYFGASGGFFCLHLLLLTEAYQCKFAGQDQNFENIFKKQWNILNTEKWKSHEIWPDNYATIESSLLNKVYFSCNDIDKLTTYPGKLIVLYTDIETQWFLARTKRAFWFERYSDSDILNHINQVFSNCYLNVKAKHWPECNSIKQFNSLPNWIKTECFEDFKFSKIWDNKLSPEDQLEAFRDSKRRQYKDQWIYEQLLTTNIINQADIVVKLQDLIKTNGEILFEQLGIKGNQRCADFVNLWLNKHTDKQRSYLLKT